MATRKSAKKQAPAPKKTTTKPAAPKKAASAPARKKAAPPAEPKKPARPARPAAPAPAAEPAQLGLTDLQQRFVDEYLVDLNGTQAAIRAGYSLDTARQMASENLSKPYIQIAIAEARKAQQARTHIEADRVVVEAWNIVFAEANQSLAHMMGNQKRARTQVDEMLVAMIVQDIGSSQYAVVIEGDDVTPARTVVLNKPEADPLTGVPHLSNDLQRTMLQVGLEDVPSCRPTAGSSSTRCPKRSRACRRSTRPPPCRSSPASWDVPFKRALVDALRAASAQETPEQVEKRIQEAVQDALAKAGNDLKARELDMKERLTEAQIKQIMAQAVQTGVQAAFAAMQGGAQVAQMPMIAPIADAITQGAGYQRPTPGGDDPNFPTPAQTAAMNIKDPYIQGQAPAALAAEGEAAAAAPVRENTSPTFPARAAEGATGMDGIETARTTYNVPA
ncbi:terminase small subunit [Variovorax sp. 350MFTsu5.1]|uniref:terminase small subunit n=1 Tax=Variovorax sp. 350MFTsu5.1 TaxID=3158365 RepID=UPI003AADEE3A